MSETQPAPLAPIQLLPTLHHPVDNLTSPQFIIATEAMVLVAFVVWQVFARGDASLINTTVGLIVGTVVGNIMGFYFASSVSSQRKSDPPPIAVPPAEAR